MYFIHKIAFKAICAISDCILACVAAYTAAPKHNQLKTATDEMKQKKYL